MALQDILEKGKNEAASLHIGEIIGGTAAKKKIGLSEERVQVIKPVLRQYIAFWREYPDLFIDFMQTGGDPTIEKKLNFYFYQRVFLRVAMRFRYVYMVFPRASITRRH